MSMKITYGPLLDVAFWRAWNKISNFTKFKSVTTLYNVTRLNSKLREEAKNVDDLWAKLVDQYAKKDEKGVPIEPQRIEGEWLLKRKELEAITVEILNARPLVLDELLEVDLSGVDLTAMEGSVLEIKEPEVEKKTLHAVPAK